MTGTSSLIGRWWRGVAGSDTADAYEQLLKTEVLPRIHRIPGYRGAYVFRRPVDAGVEFATLTLWESIDAIRAFAGQDHETAVVPPAAQRLLRDWDRRVAHYTMAGEPADFAPGGADRRATER